MQRPPNAILTFCLDNMAKSMWSDSNIGLLPTGEPHSLVFLKLTNVQKEKSLQWSAVCSSLLLFLCNIVINDLRLLINLQCLQAARIIDIKIESQLSSQMLEKHKTKIPELNLTGASVKILNSIYQIYMYGF